MFGGGHQLAVNSEASFYIFDTKSHKWSIPQVIQLQFLLDSSLFLSASSSQKILKKVSVNGFSTCTQLILPGKRYSHL